MMNSVQNLGHHKTVLFLLRTYNDLDHITPVIWKASICGFKTVFLFVEDDYSDDYRVRFIESVGAKKIESSIIKFYYWRIRPNLIFEAGKKILDLTVGAIIGRRFLVGENISCIVTEWGGPDGKGLAPFFLRPCRSMGMPNISIPHGYHSWLNNDFNITVSESLRNTGMLPQLSNRNRFSAYVVQSNNIRRYCLESGISKEKLHILGSARFCQEWFNINSKICIEEFRRPKLDTKLVVLFFLSHWVYNVDRKLTLSLLRRIAERTDAKLMIKGHTRGRQTGGLTPEEEKGLDGYDSVEYAEDGMHSPALVAESDVVVVYGSSICFEALLQRKPVCRPGYLSRNQTIFEESGVVFDARNEEEVITFINDQRLNKSRLVDSEVLARFLDCHVENKRDNSGVLQSHVDLISSKLSIR